MDQQSGHAFPIRDNTVGDDSAGSGAGGVAAPYREKHRPGFHFSARENWINDPNGLVYYGDLYHLFYQYNPHDKVWGSMHWGHAVSQDLVHWNHRPIALHADPDELGFVFSGSAVVDWNNTSGFRDGEHPPLVAVFTHHSKYDVQVQSLAYSADGGETWRMHEGNPIIANPGLRDFRDPKVFWDAPRASWVMALAAGDRVSFYGSRNLLDWRHLSDFGRTIGFHGGVWECPDLLEIPISGTGESRWVLMVSVNQGAPNGGSGTQYFVGRFDGSEFVPDRQHSLWMDYGPDNYATHSFNCLPQGDVRKIVIGWMNNWDYANHLPTAPWRGALTVPRELSLKAAAGELRLVSAPVRELAALRRRKIVDFRGNEAADGSGAITWDRLPEMLDMELVLGSPGGPAGERELRFFNSSGEALILSFDAIRGRLSAGRDAAASKMDERYGFCREISAPLGFGDSEQLRLRILKDCSSLEVFEDAGGALLTLNFFADRPLDKVSVSAPRPGLAVPLRAFAIHELAGIWN